MHFLVRKQVLQNDICASTVFVIYCISVNTPIYCIRGLKKENGVGIVANG